MYCEFPAPQPDKHESGEERSLCWVIKCQGAATVGSSAREREKAAKGDRRAGRAGTSLAEAPHEASYNSFSQVGCFHSNLVLRGFSCRISEQSLCPSCKPPREWGGGCRVGGVAKKGHYRSIRAIRACRCFQNSDGLGSTSYIYKKVCRGRWKSQDVHSIDKVWRTEWFTKLWWHK